MLYKLMCTGNLIQWESFGNIESLPARFKCLIDGASGF